MHIIYINSLLLILTVHSLCCCELIRFAVDNKLFGIAQCFKRDIKTELHDFSRCQASECISFVGETSRRSPKSGGLAENCIGGGHVRSLYQRTMNTLPVYNAPKMWYDENCRIVARGICWKEQNEARMSEYEEFAEKIW